MLLRAQAQRATSINYTAHRHMNINKMNTSKSRWINKKQIILQYKYITVANYSWDESNWLVYTSTIKMFQTYFYKWIISTREALYLCMNWRKAASFFTEMLLWVDREHMCMMVKLAVQKNKTHWHHFRLQESTSRMWCNVITNKITQCMQAARKPSGESFIC